MAKKSKFAKVVVALGAIGVASKIAYDKYKNVKDDFVKEETASAEDDVKKYNAIFEKKVVEVEDEEFMGCEVKAVGSKAVIDLGLAVFERDVYINFSSNASTVTIILPEGVNVTCDVEKKLSGVRNLVENSDEDGVHTVYIIGKAVCSNVEIIPVNFYIDDDDFEDIDDSEVLSGECINSPVLGQIPPERLSGGVKTLLLILNEPDRIFNASTCGDNCAKWILEIGRIKDVTINLRHMMSFGKDTKFEIKVQNGGETVHSMKELVPIANKYLNEMKQE